MKNGTERQFGSGVSESEPSVLLHSLPPMTTLSEIRSKSAARQQLSARRAFREQKDALLYPQSSLVNALLESAARHVTLAQKLETNGLLAASAAELLGTNALLLERGAMDQSIFKGHRSALNLMASDALKARQMVWVDDISRRMAELDLRPIMSALEMSPGFLLRERLRDALYAIDLPSALDDGDSASTLIDEIAIEVERTATDESGSGIGAAIRSVLSRSVENDGLSILLFQVICRVALMVMLEGVGAVLEVEYGRWRNAADESLRAKEESRQSEVLVEVAQKLELIQHRLSTPPMTAEVVRRALLRSAPDSGAAVVRPLDPKTRLTVLERRDGWIRVEAEPTPGDVFEGWVYGRLTRYLP